MNQIQHELKINASRKRVLDALTDRAALAHWHGAAVTGDGREWRLVYPSGTVFRWKVVASGADGVTWLCEEGPGNATGTQVRFALSDADAHRTRVELAHSGWQTSDPKLRTCNTLWGGLLYELKRFAETAAA
ncbi:MAG TPA: SRPBCC domain-containing protein [Casimicrobiaceae bacterium]|jgi:uncharacterized protein YndB with AHSA1/START domain